MSRRPPKVSDIRPQKIFHCKTVRNAFVSFTIATLSNILNDKHTPQKMQTPICQIQEKRTKNCSEEFVSSKSFFVSWRITNAGEDMLDKTRKT